MSTLETSCFLTCKSWQDNAIYKFHVTPSAGRDGHLRLLVTLWK